MCIYCWREISTNIITSFGCLNRVNKTKEWILNFALMPCYFAFAFCANNYFTFLDEIVIYKFVFVLNFTKTGRLYRAIRWSERTFHCFRNFGGIVLSTIFESGLQGVHFLEGSGFKLVLLKVVHFLFIVFRHSRTQLFNDLFSDSFNTFVLERVLIELSRRIFIHFIHFVNYVLQNDEEFVINWVHVFL